MLPCAAWLGRWGEIRAVAEAAAEDVAAGEEEVAAEGRHAQAILASLSVRLERGSAGGAGAAAAAGRCVMPSVLLTAAAGAGDNVEVEEKEEDGEEAEEEASPWIRR